MTWSWCGSTLRPIGERLCDAGVPLRQLGVFRDIAAGGKSGTSRGGRATVFIILARKAGSLGPKTILSGWLYRTACFVSAAAVKQGVRRQRGNRRRRWK